MVRLTKEVRKERRLKRKEGIAEPYLTPTQQAFVDNYCTREAPTYMRGFRSMTAAGYGEVNATTLKNLLSNHRITWMMDEFWRKKGAIREMTRAKVVDMLLDQYNKADVAEDRSNAIRAAELLGKSIAMFSDKFVISDETQVRIAEARAKEALALASTRLEDIFDSTATILDAEQSKELDKIEFELDVFGSKPKEMAELQESLDQASETAKQDS